MKNTFGVNFHEKLTGVKCEFRSTVDPLIEKPTEMLTGTSLFFSLKILRDAQTLAERMYHRGACACDNDTGDGAGVLTAIPHHLYTKEL